MGDLGDALEEFDVLLGRPWQRALMRLFGSTFGSIFPCFQAADAEIEPVI